MDVHFLNRSFFIIIYVDGNILSHEMYVLR